MTTDIKPCRPKWKGTLTDRERFRRQMHFETVDRCFNREFGYWDENFKLWPIFLENQITNNDDADIFFNFDVMKRIEHHWMYPLYEEKVIDRRGNKNIIINKYGLLAEVPADGHDTIPHYIKPTIVTPGDWQKCKAERFTRGHSARVVDIDALKKQHPSDRDYPLGVYAGSMIGVIRNVLTFEGLAYAMHDYPEMVEDMVETTCLLAEDFLDQVLAPIDFDFAWGWEDICFKSGPIVSVPFFKNVIVPRYKRIKAKLAAHGIDIWWTDCDGDVRPILPLLLEGGINCLFPFEVNSCCRPADLLTKYGKELLIMGGFDKMALGAGHEAITEYMQSLIPLVNRGGFIPFCDHRCPPNVKQEDYLFYLDLKEKTFGMK